MITTLARLTLLALLVSPIATRAMPIELFFSEYIEGTSQNKALEIFNGTGAAIDLAAGGYKIEFYFNGSSTAGATINLTTVVAHGDVFVLAHSSAVAAVLALADQTFGGSWYNGDDAIVLRKGTVIIDRIGQVGFDPGTEWGSGLTSTADNTLRRKAGVLGGDTNASAVFDPSLEWEGFAVDTFDGLGAHRIVVAVSEPPVLALVLLLALVGCCLSRLPARCYTSRRESRDGDLRSDDLPRLHRLL